MANAKGPVCVVCGGTDEVYPKQGSKRPMCKGCFGEWEQSPEHARMVTAHNDFVTRRKKELGK